MCENWSHGDKLEWINNRGEELSLTDTEGSTKKQRKYVLYNDLRIKPVVGECSLVIRNITWEDKGDYICRHMQTRYKFIPENNNWIPGYKTYKITLIVTDLVSDLLPKDVLRQLYNETKHNDVKVEITTKSREVITEGTKPENTTHRNITLTNVGLTTIATPITTAKSMTEVTTVTITKVVESPLLALAESEEVITPPFVNKTATTTLEHFPLEITPKSNLTTVSNMSWNNSSTTVRPTEMGTTQTQTTPEIMSFENDEWTDLDETSPEMFEQYRSINKREAKWKAFGFDSSTLHIADPFASRNLWFQQLTHSVRAVNPGDEPCMVRVPSPCTWQSIMESSPQPLGFKCQAMVMSWLFFNQEADKNDWLYTSRMYKPINDCAWLSDLPYINSLDKEGKIVPPEPLEISSVKTDHCICSNNTYGRSGVYLGIAECKSYGMKFGKVPHGRLNDKHYVSFRLPNSKHSKILIVLNQTVPGNMTLGTLRDIWWICGDKAYIFLPHGWVGCCYMATLKLPYEVLVIRRGQEGVDSKSVIVPHGRAKREMAQFSNLESYHWRISLGEKWGIGLLPWYGVTFLADHIDNITYTLQGFANETIKGFSTLTNTQKSHRLTLLKHDMALDYILAKQGGLCMALNLTGDACCTLVPDSSENMTNVIDALKVIRDAFGPSKSAGWSANAWLQDKFGPVGAIVIQVVIAVVLSLCVMFCCCTLVLTFAKALILRWNGVVLPGDQTQMPLVQDGQDNDLCVGEDRVGLDFELIDKYLI